jgi:signal transduction histidine kinase
MAPAQKDVIGSKITRAQAELTDALAELEKIPDVAAGVVPCAAHALNNYLAVICAAVHLILRQLKDHPDQQITDWLNSVIHATDLMGKVVSELATGSGSPEPTLRFEQVDLALSLRRFCDFYEETASHKLIRLIVDSGNDVAPVMTDRVAILSVLDNLVSNAIKYSPPERRVWLGARSENDSVVCRVRDEGPGLNPGDQTRLFQKGARLTPRPTAGEPSTGYGLAVAKDLMDKLGGSIWCESVLGQGTTFFIRLPACHTAAAA